MRTGKQTVYHALQDSAQDATPVAIEATNKEIEKAHNQLSIIKADEKRVRAALAALDAKPRISDLKQDIQKLETEREAIQAQLGDSQGSNDISILVEDRSKLEQEWKQWQRRVTVRRRICRDLWSQCTEVLPEDTTLQDLWVSCYG